MDSHSNLNDEPRVLAVLLESRNRFTAFLRRRVNNPDDVEEILQSAFAKAVDKEQSINTEENAVAWFYRLLRNSVIDFYRNQLWLQVKFALVLILVVYHFICGKYVKQFAQDICQHSDKYFRFFNEFPVLILVAIVILVVVRPF